MSEPTPATIARLRAERGDARAQLGAAEQRADEGEGLQARLLEHHEDVHLVSGPSAGQTLDEHLGTTPWFRAGVVVEGLLAVAECYKDARADPLAHAVETCRLRRALAGAVDALNGLLAVSGPTDFATTATGAACQHYRSARDTLAATDCGEVNLQGVLFEVMAAQWESGRTCSLSALGESEARSLCAERAKEGADLLMQRLPPPAPGRLGAAVWAVGRKAYLAGWTRGYQRHGLRRDEGLEVTPRSPEEDIDDPDYGLRREELLAAALNAQPSAGSCGGEPDASGCETCDDTGWTNFGVTCPECSPHPDPGCEVCDAGRQRVVGGGELKAMPCPNCGPAATTSELLASTNLVDPLAAAAADKFEGWLRGRWDNACHDLGGWGPFNLVVAEAGSFAAHLDEALQAEVAELRKRLADQDTGAVLLGQERLAELRAEVSAGAGLLAKATDRINDLQAEAARLRPLLVAEPGRLQRAFEAGQRYQEALVNRRRTGSTGGEGLPRNALDFVAYLIAERDSSTDRPAPLPHDNDKDKDNDGETEA